MNEIIKTCLLISVLMAQSIAATPTGIQINAPIAGIELQTLAFITLLTVGFILWGWTRRETLLLLFAGLFLLIMGTYVMGGGIIQSYGTGGYLLQVTQNDFYTQSLALTFVLMSFYCFLKATQLIMEFFIKTKKTREETIKIYQ